MRIARCRVTRFGARAALLSGCAAAALVVLPVWGAAAQDSTPTPAPTPASTPAPAPAPEEPRDPPGTIIVIGNRTIVASLADLAVEQTYDEDAVDSYAAGSVGEVIDAIREENGDDDPAILVNGRPVADTSDISDLPPEAIARIETLPRGAAQRVNGAAGQRAYNVVLKSSVRTAIATVSDEIATDGGWSNKRGDVQFTSVKGQNRLNLAVRGGSSGYLLESERPYVPRVEDTYYAPIGNILPIAGGQVDPALSALAGRPVTSAALPAGVTAPTLAALLAGANNLNPSGRADYRTLRGASRPLDISLSGSRQLNDVLSLSFNARAGWTDNRSLNGLARARVTIPTTNGFTPFSVPVSLQFEDPDRPLHSRSKSNSQGLSFTINSTGENWRGTLNARYDRRESNSEYEFSGSLPTLASTTNPFAGTLAASIPVTASTSGTITTTAAIVGEASGTLFKLWAGPVGARLSTSGEWDTFKGTSSSSPNQTLKQHEASVGGGLTVPLTSRDPGFLGAFGDSELAFDIGYADLGDFGSLRRSALALNWQPVQWLRVVAKTTRDETAVALPFLASPTTIINDVPYFDPLTGQTVNITSIFGGAGGLLPQDRRVRGIAVTANPWTLYNMQLDAEYTVEDLRNQIGSLPDPSAAVLAAFPERFVRDASGTLVLVDGRSINLTRERSEELRFGLRCTLPLSGPPQRVPASGGRPSYRTPQTKLQVTLSHTELLSNSSIIRPGLPVVDLLEGTVIGFGGSRPRQSTSANFALTRGASGLRVDFRRRGSSKVLYGSLANPRLLDFAPLTTLDLKLYADLGEYWRGSKIAKGTRVTFTIDNAFNRRQSVTDQAGFEPQAYQKIRRDPLGRTVMFELRKSF